MPSSTAPATDQRKPENTPGGTVAVPAFMPIQVAPHMMQRKPNIRSCVGVVLDAMSARSGLGPQV